MHGQVFHAGYSRCHYVKRQNVAGQLALIDIPVFIFCGPIGQRELR
jgi:hypothetical protein